MAEEIIKKAVLIDDALARPNSGDINTCLPAIRTFLTDNPEVKTWFDESFELTGNHTTRNYFAPLSANPSSILRLWELRRSTPKLIELTAHAFSTLEAELAPYHEPLNEINAVLATNGWEVQSHSKLPSIEDITPDISVVIIDYLLKDSQPEQAEQAIAESLEFLSQLVKRARVTPNCKIPFLILISSLPNAVNNAQNFRSDVKTPGALFRFIKKVHISEQFPLILLNYSQQHYELHQYCLVQQSLAEAIQLGANALIDQIDSLELEDIATLHAGQLVTEKNPFQIILDG